MPVRFLKLFALIAVLALIGAACGGDDSDSGDVSSDDSSSSEGEPGGELIDGGTLVGDPPEHIDPALNVTLDAYQIVNALYDGLTEVDYSDPENPEVVGLVAESFEPNDDATEWTFTIKDGLTFSDGTPVLPSSFVRAWERASNPDFAGDYSYLFSFIEGGQEKLDGEAETLAGVTADDDAMTLTVQMSEPYSNFPAVAGFQLFFPMPEAVDDLADQNDWENGDMIGNGPFKLEAPRTDEEIVLVRNDEWGGDIYGNTSATLDKITFLVSPDVDTAYNALEAGETDTAVIAPGRVQQAENDYATTLDVGVIANTYFEIKQDNPVVGGPENKLLRQAISLAIDRDEINEAVYEGSRPPADGITPPGIPGYEAGLCENCSYDPDAAQQAYDDWKAEGNEITEPIKIQLDNDGQWDSMVQIIVDNLDAIGIPAVAEPLDDETYFTQLSDGACVICRSGWYADYPTYDNFMFDLFSTGSGNNHGFYSNEEFDAKVAEAKAETDPDAQAALFREAEQILLNEDIGVIPINFTPGDQIYNPETVTNFPQSPLGIISYELVTVDK
jgi:ABC-type transport system substrate-binding protein